MISGGVIPIQTHSIPSALFGCIKRFIGIRNKLVRVLRFIRLQRRDADTYLDMGAVITVTEYMLARK
jgi:hypothetical protein